MSIALDSDRLIEGCRDDSLEAGIRIVTDLEPLAGRGMPVKPPVYEGGRYQLDKRWESPNAEAPTAVVVLDQVPSQANRLEAAARSYRGLVGLPELVLDLSGAALPPHLPREISSWQFPHRNADAYLRDARLNGEDFVKSALGKSLIDATPARAAALMAWFPQALLFGFWQSHLGKKQASTKHARAWVSEIIGWRPATIDTKVFGLKGDPLNLNTDEQMTFNPADQSQWTLGKTGAKGEETKKLSEIGHGQVPFMRESDASPAGVSFARISQTATVSFAQLRRLALGEGHGPEADAAARALLAGLGLFTHVFAFSGSFELRSVADLRSLSTAAEWLGAGPATDVDLDLPDRDSVVELVGQLKQKAGDAGVPLDGWDVDPIRLSPKDNLMAAVRATWGLPDAVDNG